MRLRTQIEAAQSNYEPLVYRPLTLLDALYRVESEIVKISAAQKRVEVTFTTFSTCSKEGPV